MEVDEPSLQQLTQHSELSDELEDMLLSSGFTSKLDIFIKEMIDTCVVKVKKQQCQENYKKFKSENIGKLTPLSSQEFLIQDPQNVDNDELALFQEIQKLKAKKKKEVKRLDLKSYLINRQVTYDNLHFDRNLVGSNRSVTLSVF